jgi:hypothetical protein
MADQKQGALLHAAEHADWGQVVANGGPPCFHICEDGLFCLRAKRWEGHAPWTGSVGHDFVSLAQMLASRVLKEVAK